MARSLLACLGVVAAGGIVAASVGGPRPPAAASEAMRSYDAAIAQTDAAVAGLAAAAAAHDLGATRRGLRQARLAYKRIEWLAEHYTPLTAAGLNGPAVDRPDDENPVVVVRPTGFQVVEAMIYRAHVDDRLLDSVATQARIARVNLRRLRERAAETSVADAQLFDAARAEVARIVTLGITGFDTPLAESAIPEAAASVRALARALSGYAPGTPAADSLRQAARRAAAYLDAHPAFDGFDRLEFIVRYANPFARRLGALQRAAGVARLADPRPWSAAASTVFDRDAFDPHGFAPPGAPPNSPALAAVGARLFTETRLSGRHDRSCVSCHDPARAFTDRRRLPRLVPATGPATETPRAPRNTPTLYNAALQAASFADARVAFLEDQVTAVVNDRREMGGDLEHAAAALYDDPSYRRAFAGAFGALPERAGMSRAVRLALAAYLRSLVRLDSRFDRAVRGDGSALSDDERRGFNLFMGKARCGTCHFAPLFNGTVPPGYTESEVEVIGVPRSARRHSPLDPDRGVGASDRAPLHDNAFKTPTVRNAAVTAPYMHNGAFRTLAEVVDFYDAGGGAGLGLRVPNQTLPADSLHLTRAEKRALVAFIETLTDTTKY